MLLETALQGLLPFSTQKIAAGGEGKNDRVHGQRRQKLSGIVWMGRACKCPSVNKQHPRCVDGAPSGAIVQNSDSGTGSKCGVSTPMRARHPEPSGCQA